MANRFFRLEAKFAFRFAVMFILGLGAARGATVTIINGDSAGVGFNDPTAVAPVGGNTGTTLGAQRLIVFQAVAAKWGAILTSNVTIRVNAVWTALTCSTNSAVLGSAGPSSIYRDFTNATVSGHWFPKALANKLAGFDLNSANVDISANFNVNLGQPGCLANAPFYLGLDYPTLPSQTRAQFVDLFGVVLHEFGHGLGFLTFTSGSTGTMAGGFPSIWDDFLLDNSTNKHWTDMTSAERVASAKAVNHLVWTGPNTNYFLSQVLSAAGASFLGADFMGRPFLYTPSTYSNGSSVSHWDTTLTPNQVMEPFINSNLQHEVTPNFDLTYPLLQDIGWGGTSVPKLTITASHTGSFFQGQTAATYLLTVANGGTLDSSGAINVSDVLPAGLTATAISGAGWNCTLGNLTCNRSDVLAIGSSFPAITVTVNVAANASTPLLNTANVWGGRSVPQTVTDTTSIQSAASSPCTLSTSQVQAGASGGNYTVSGTGACSFTVTGLPTWIFVAGTSATSVTLSVAPNSGAARSANITIAGIAYIVNQQASSVPGLSLMGSMPQLASAGSWETTFTLVNTGLNPVTARTNFFADDGSALNLPLTFPQTPSAGTVLASSLDRTLAANASLILDSTGPDTQAVQVGGAQLLGTGKVGGFAIFKYKFAGQEAAVPLETRNAPSYLLAFDNTNSVALGVALQNVSGSSASVPVIIRDDTGAVIGNATLTLAASGHTSFVLPTQYPVTANRRGTIEFDTPPGGQISVLGIRFTPPGTLTTIPVLANVNTNGGSVAHIASGGGWMTTVVLVNTGNATAQAHLRFFDDNGGALTLPLSFPQNGTNSSASAVNPTITANASLVITSAAPSASPVQIGSMQLSADGPVSGYVIFRYTPNGQEASAPFQNLGASAYVIPFDHTGSIVTGIAVNNASGQTVNIPVILRDDLGNQIGTGSLALAGNGHTAFSLASQFPATSNIRGTVEFDTPVGGQINVLGIRTPPALTFTTLPPLTK